MEQRKTAYERWIEQEAIPVVEGYGVRDVRRLALGPWKRLGGRGAYVQMKGLEGIFHMKQRRSLFGQGVNISNWNRGQTSDKMPDLMPSNVSYDATFDTCGVACSVDLRQYEDRVDYLNFGLWGRAETNEGLHFKKTGNMGPLFPVFDGNGDMTTQVQFHLVSEFDYYSVDPGIGLVIDSLLVP